MEALEEELKQRREGTTPGESTPTESWREHTRWVWERNQKWMTIWKSRQRLHSCIIQCIMTINLILILRFADVVSGWGPRTAEMEQVKDRNSDLCERNWLDRFIQRVPGNNPNPNPQSQEPQQSTERLIEAEESHGTLRPEREQLRHVETERRRRRKRRRWKERPSKIEPKKSWGRATVSLFCGMLSTPPFPWVLQVGNREVRISKFLEGTLKGIAPLSPISYL